VIWHDPQAPCDRCDHPLGDWDYRYRGKHYCRTCYTQLFGVRTCSVCGRLKWIDKSLTTPVCKHCQVKDQPCIRCGATIHKKNRGKITEYGPVCASCRIHYREPRKCSQCGKADRGVARYRIDGVSTLLCSSCYSAALPLCALCRRKRPSYHYREDGKPVCKACATKPSRSCRQCGTTIPAGRGWLCQECSSRNGLKRKARFGAQSLSPFFREYFTIFSLWLADERGAGFASRRLLYFLPFVQELDTLALRLDRMPTYAEIVGSLQVATARAHLTFMLFLHKQQVIQIDPKIKEDYAQQDMIDRYRESMKDAPRLDELLQGYYRHLAARFDEGKSSRRSLRLSLGSAVNFLKYCRHTGAPSPSEELLRDYLWCFWGQKASLHSFIVYLNAQINFPVKMAEIPKPVFQRPMLSRAMLKQRFLRCLQDISSPEGTNIQSDQCVRLAIGFLHGVDIPEGINIRFSLIRRYKDGLQIQLGGRRFYLPKEIEPAVRSMMGRQH